MQIDLNLTITAIIALIALVSPIATAIINNCYQLKLKNIELYEIAKRQCLEEFIKATSNYYDSSNSLGEIVDLHSHVNNLYIYFDNVPEAVNNLSSLSGQTLTKELTNIVTELSKQIKKK